MSKELLLQEKKRHGLKEEISKHEEKLLEEGVPIQKIMGFIDFSGIRINLNHNVLIPRYETEEVVLKALQFIDKDSKVLDLGCGSGFIGLTIRQNSGAEVTLSDIDDEAITQTKENAKINNLDVTVIKSDLFENIDSKFDLIISNPPYIPINTKLDDSVINHEPRHALFAGEDGNDFYKRILAEAKNYLNENGYIFFEISPDNSEYIKSKGFEVLEDINGKERIALKKF